MKDKIITLAALCILGLFLGTILDGAKAQNHSDMGHAPWYKTKREREIIRCMSLPDIKDVQTCVARMK